MLNGIVIELGEPLHYFEEKKMFKISKCFESF